MDGSFVCHCMQFELSLAELLNFNGINSRRSQKKYFLKLFHRLIAISYVHFLIYVIMKSQFSMKGRFNILGKYAYLLAGYF